MKHYESRHQLKEDVDFIKSIVTDTQQQNVYIHSLFEQWMYTSPDSPFNDLSYDDIIGATTLLQINKDGIKTEWCGDHIIFEDISPKKNKRYNLRSNR